MKKTVNVNVGGFAFVIEETAYEQLSMYLNNVRRNLGNDVDANEVMNDIESRIAELFREALRTSGREVVDSSLIDRVIAVMGKPEDYGDGSESQKSQEQYAHHQQEHIQRTLFRDSENKMLGGVASGLANYFGWDPLAFRIIFVLLLFGFGIGLPLYIVLWILIPEAKTTADKLRMRGQPVNVDTIKKRFNDFKSDVSNLGSKENQRKVKDTAHSIGSRIEGLFSDFGRVIARVLGTFMLLAGIVMVVFLLKYLITGSVSIPQSAGEELFIQHREIFFDNPFDFYCLVGGICLLATMVLYGFISSGLELLFRVRIKSKPVKYATITFSVVAIMGILYGGINVVKHYAYDKTIEHRYEVPLQNNTVEIEVLRDNYFNNKVTSTYTSGDELIHVSPTRIVFDYPSLSIKLSETNRAYVEVQRSASGSRELKAIENCEAIDYPVRTDSGRVQLPPVFSTSYKSKYRQQDVDVTLYVPRNTIITNAGNMKRMFDPYNSWVTSNELPEAAQYLMTEDGLVEFKGNIPADTARNWKRGLEDQFNKDLQKQSEKILKDGLK